MVEGGAEAGAQLRSIWRFDTAALSVPTGLRSAAAIALPLIVGIGTGHPRAAGWGAVGAFLTDMTMGQPEHRFRARIVAGAAVFVALGGCLGALCGIWGWVIYPLVAVWTVASGLMVAVGPRAALVGVSSTTGLLYAASFRVSTVQSFEVGAWMLGAGLAAAAIGWATHLVVNRRATPVRPRAPGARPRGLRMAAIGAPGQCAGISSPIRCSGTTWRGSRP